MDSIEEWIRYIKKNSSRSTVSSEWVVTDTFLAFNNENILVGIISLHYELNDFLKYFGQIGYSIRPLQRKKGYAIEMLKETLKIAKDKGLNNVIISTKEDNIASIKTIEKNGGYLIKSIEYLDYIIKMYRIDL